MMNFFLSWIWSYYSLIGQDTGGKNMDISEKQECYVYGQCQVLYSMVQTSIWKALWFQEYSVNFERWPDAESCHKFCTKNKDCEWWSWEPTNTLCVLYANCTESGYPDTAACPHCISGQQLWENIIYTVLLALSFQPSSFSCPARECHSPKKCKGHFVDSNILKGGHLEDCIKSCSNNALCEYYTLEKSKDYCILYEDCLETEGCDTCWTGRKYCSRGYQGEA